MDLTIACAGVTILALGFYVILDGFDLGVGALMLAAPTRELRDMLAESIEPAWDGNETWLIMTGVSLLAAFPLAYSILLPALYIPLIAMLLGLGFRAVAFDFRRQEGPMQRFWDLAFSLGSIGAALAQGGVLGVLLQGIQVRDGTFSGSQLDVFQPLPVVCALAVLCAYAVLGAAWARWRLPSSDGAFLRMHVNRGLPAAVILLVAALVLAAREQPALLARWREYPIAFGSLAIALLIVSAGVRQAMLGSRDLRPFLLALLGAGIALIGFVLSVLPGIVPFRVDIWTAAAPPASQKVYLIGSLIVIPVILGYTGFAYWVFRGKIAAEQAR